MNVIKIGNVSFTLPEGWGELTEKQVLSVCDLFHLSGYERRAAVFVRLVKDFGFFMRRKIWAKLPRLNDVQFTQLLDVLAWADNLPQQSIRPVFTIDGEKFFPPDELMTTSVLIEYVFADAYLENADMPGMLENLFFTLWRPQGEGSADKRIRYDADQCQANAQRHKITPEMRIAAVLLFVATKKHIATTYKRIFPKLPENAPKTQSSAAAVWQRTIFAISETHVFGNLEAVKFANIYEVLAYLDYKKEEQEAATGWQTVSVE